jgi:FkbM family methyltransferase
MAQVVGRDGFILGIEATPHNTVIAQSQVTLNNLGRTCMVLNRACSDTKRTLMLSNDSNASVITEGNSRVINVEAVTGEYLFENYGPFDVLKIDVEGFEGRVLAGCQTILASRPKLALELHLPSLAKYGSSVETVSDKY